MPDNDDHSLLRVQDLSVCFGARSAPVRAVDGVSFAIGKGEAVALVGESGCGKSVTALSLARLVAEPPGWYERGAIRLNGRQVLTLGTRALTRLRGREIAYVFQEPSVS
ncbi:MAG: ATP-binding cassette domain-containing protein, partial [Spartobacteria bacterium]|nr:ATP-binding cassette domain-containing protein [Spartobacteria bacterium]